MKWNRQLPFVVAALLPVAGYTQQVATGTRVDLKLITGHYHAGHRVGTKIANEKGWFRDEGLGRVEITPLGTNDDHMTLAELARGRADIVWDAHSDIVVQEDAGGASLAIIDVFRSFQPRNLLFAGAGVKNIRELKGKRVGVNEMDGMDAWEIRKGLERAGLDPERDVVWVPHMRGQYARGTPLEILQRRDVDAMTARSAEVAALRNAGFTLVADLTTAFPLGYPIRVLVARRALVEQNPAAVEAFLRAITRAKRFAADPKNAAEELAFRRQVLDEDLTFGGERAEAARGELRTLTTDDGSDRRDYFDPKGVALVIEEQKKLKRVSASYRGDRLVHADLLQRAVAQVDTRFGAGGYQ